MESTAPVIEHLPIDQLGADLADRLGPERTAAWSRNREPYRPQVTVVHGPDGEAAALTSGRPNTRYTKIVDIWSTTDTAAERLLQHLIASSLDRGDACIKWELPIGENLPRFGAAAGFIELQTPIVSGAGTDEVRGFALWHGGFPHAQLRYYSQTTDFTCGAVAAMTALTALGLDPFGVTADDGARERELAFWRQATNFPACEPVGLAVALHDALAPATGYSVELHLDTEGPVLLEEYTGADREYRALLQAESAEQARARGIQRHADRVEVAEIVRRVAEGDYALLLIDDAQMHDSSTPHWVLAHAAKGDTVLLHEPWATDQRAETWVDSHDLPVAADVLDRLVSWGDPAYRGVIFITR
ncbi:peptidase C39 family protein [Homoserinimonas sp. OAct 916]|uniref:peptidase C39 family protein n=1 Tax=Homoserinimonas sp. OAct 916 TaxID=2211450 RepID=UPI000DBE1F52|nr:peptidase C39 family protein [Homoserinimonas sp. OAct 916]